MLAADDLRLKGDPADITGSVQGKRRRRKNRRSPRPPAAEGVQARRRGGQPRSARADARHPSARSWKRLQARRQELEARAREVDIRESLLKAAEKRIEAKVEEAKANDAKADADAAAEGRSGRRPIQGHRHDVREHEAEGRRQKCSIASR